MGIPGVDCWVEKLEALLGVGLGLKFHELKWPAISANVPSLEDLLPSWIIPILSRRSADHRRVVRPSDRWWTNYRQVCSGSVPFRFSKFERGWTNYLLQHMRQHAVLVFLGASLPWCGMGWVFGHMNHQQIEKRDMIQAYAYLHVQPP